MSIGAPASTTCGSRTATKSSCSPARCASVAEGPGVEILAGLHDGDVAGRAMKLGLSGILTRTFITSPLTPLLLIAALIAGAFAVALAAA